MIFNYRVTFTNTSKDTSLIAFAMSKLVLFASELKSKGIFFTTLSVNTKNNIGELVMQLKTNNERAKEISLYQLDLLIDKISKEYNVIIKCAIAE